MAYCAGQDLLNLALPIPALSPLVQAQVAAVCQAESDVADGYFRGRWGYSAVPLLAWDTSVTFAVARRAAFSLMRVRGLKPDGADWKLFESVHTEATAWLDKVQRQQAHPLVILANGSAPGGAQPIVISSSVVNLSNGCRAPTRGW